MRVRVRLAPRLVTHPNLVACIFEMAHAHSLTLVGRGLVRVGVGVGVKGLG